MFMLYSAILKFQTDFFWFDHVQNRYPFYFRIHSRKKKLGKKKGDHSPPGFYASWWRGNFQFFPLLNIQCYRLENQGIRTKIGTTRIKHAFGSLEGVDLEMRLATYIIYTCIIYTYIVYVIYIHIIQYI